MSSSSNTNGQDSSTIEVDFKTMMESNNDIDKQHILTISDGNIPQARVSVNGSRILDDLSPHTTVTFRNICKIINIPGKMIDPPSKEKIVQRTLLDNVSGQIHPGELVALMGPSGCGKTTLLNILAGRTLNGVTGDIWFNNQRFEKSMKRKLAYVLQQDIFFENLTVKQQLTYTALLRLPNHLSRKDKLAQVEEIIEQLRLQNCANTPIMLISGGEKKRTNIGTELLTNPSVIFLDEPTSGLDSTSAVALMGVLRELTSKNKTIITSIHQPSSQIFHLFDQLILLADGKTIFMGKPSNVLDYFDTLGHHSPAHYNPADFIMDLVNQDMEVRQELKEAYTQNKFTRNENNLNSELQEPQKYSIEGRKYLIGEPSGTEAQLINDNNVKLIAQNHESKWPIGFLPQLSILISRNWILTSKAQFTVLALTQTVCLAVIYGLFWLRMPFNETSMPDRASSIFLIILYWPFEILYSSLLSFPNERSIIDKERASGSFRLSAYFLAKSLSEGPLKLVLPTMFFIIIYWMMNINSNFANFLGIIVFLLMPLLIAESIGLLLGASFHNISKGLVVATAFVNFAMLAGGYFVRNPPYWLIVWTKWLSLFKYSYDACIRLQFMGVVYQCVDGLYIDVCKNNTSGTFTGDDALPYFHVDLSIGLNFLVLLGMFIAVRFAAYIALRFSKNNNGRT